MDQVHLYFSPLYFFREGPGVSYIYYLYCSSEKQPAFFIAGVKYNIMRAEV